MISDPSIYLNSNILNTRMKNIGNKVLIFYYFQLQSNRDYNVTSISNNGQPPTIKDVLSILPFDLTHGLYHFRFKSELTDGDQKILGWIDINNIAAKVPQVNGSIYMKILKLKDPAHNKLFHLEKLRKAEIIKVNINDHHFHSAPKPMPSPHTANTARSSKDPNSPQHPNLISTVPPNKVEAKVIPQKVNPPTSLLEPAKNEKNIITEQKAPSPAPAAPVVPEKPKLNTTSIEQNLETFNKQFKDEEQHKQNERIAQMEFQDRIRKWGYTDGKKINNTTTLLATLHEIWPEWESVSLTDMLKPEQVTALFKKAVIKVHPDKNRSRHFKEKYLSKRIFELLNESRKQV